MKPELEQILKDMWRVIKRLGNPVLTKQDTEAYRRLKEKLDDEHPNEKERPQ